LRKRKIRTTSKLVKGLNTYVAMSPKIVSGVEDPVLVEVPAEEVPLLSSFCGASDGSSATQALPVEARGATVVLGVAQEAGDHQALRAVVS
jgi:hypothetical protein